MRFSTAVAALSAAAAVSAASYGNGTEFTTTEVVTKYTTFCPGPTTVVQNSKTYTVTAATTLTIEDCPCTVTKTYASVPAGKPTATGASSKPTGTGSSGSGSHPSGVAGPSGTGSSGSGSGHHGSYPSGAAGPSGTGSGSSPSESGIYGNGTKTSSGSGSGNSASAPASPSASNPDSGASRTTLAGGVLAGLLAGVAYML